MPVEVMETTFLPRITVALAIYNGEEYLEEAIESILAQTFSDFEVIAVDDGSTDGTLSILRRHEAHDERVRVVTRENRGRIPSLNEILGLARGEYYARMDADDICNPDRFRKQIEYMDDHPEVVCVGTAYELVDPAGRSIAAWTPAPEHESIDRAHLTGITQITHPTAMIRADSLRAVGGYHDAYECAEDIDLWLRLAEVGELGNMPDVLLRYRQHPKSVGYARRTQQREEQWRAVRDAAARRGLPFDLPEPKEQSRGEDRVYARWAWWALRGGNVATARHYAIRAFCQHPFSTASWRLAACAIRGY